MNAATHCAEPGLGGLIAILTFIAVIVMCVVAMEISRHRGLVRLGEIAAEVELKSKRKEV